MTEQATYYSEDLEVTFSYKLQEEDYGVEGSPRWMEPVDFFVEEVKILGVVVPFKDLPEPLKHKIYYLYELLDF